MDILNALAGVPKRTGTCSLQKAIDAIPDDHPNKTDFLAAVEDAKAYPSDRLSVVITQLGMKCDRGVIQEHRRTSCACYR